MNCVGVLGKRGEKMKKLLFVLITIFSVLTIIGAVYVLRSGGTVNAGYAVVPCTISLALQAVFQSKYRE